jgi:hypothetical protein
MILILEERASSSLVLSFLFDIFSSDISENDMMRKNKKKPNDVSSLKDYGLLLVFEEITFLEEREPLSSFLFKKLLQ